MPAVIPLLAHTLYHSPVLGDQRLFKDQFDV
jgi:hypothetical protein